MDSSTTLSTRSSPELRPQTNSSLSSSTQGHVMLSSRMRPKQSLVTSLPITTTFPLAISNNSSKGSLVSVTSAPPTNTSPSNSPDGVQSSTQFSASVASTLMDSTLSLTSPTSPPLIVTAMHDAMKSPSSLMRRLSRGAHNRIGRRRTSTASSSRDRSAGPVIMRRRSNSNRLMVDLSQDVSDYELDSLDPHEEDAVEYSPEEEIKPDLPLPESRPSIAPSVSGDGIAPTVPLVLQVGVWMIKFTKKQRKRLFFRLDFEAGKLFWDPHNSSKQIYIDDIKSIRFGNEAREYRENLGLPADQANRFLTLVYSDNSQIKNKTLHILADEPEMRDLWIDSINRISQIRIQTMEGIVKGGEKSLEDLWRRETRSEVAESPSRLDFSNVKRICKSYNINISDITLLDHFHKADYNHCGSLDFVQFRSFMKHLVKRQDIKQIFKKIRKQGSRDLDLESFLAFVKNTQGVDVDAHMEFWTSLFKRSCKSGQLDPVTSRPVMTSAEFQDVMMLRVISGGVSTWMPKKPLTRPLNEYFISSSHNTYLTGKQFFDLSSTEGYVSVLASGCRCVEIDCWDGQDGRPIVTHGRSFTTSSLFSDCINVINDNAFKFSEYPLIISLEVHCNPSQQVKMVEIMKQVFGEKLILQPITPESTTLPSPEELKGRILIKVKASSDEMKQFHSALVLGLQKNKQVTSPMSVPLKPMGSPLSGTPLASPPTFSLNDDVNAMIAAVNREPHPASFSTPISPSSSGEEESDVVYDTTSTRRKKHSSKTIRVLSELGVYAKGIKFSNFRSPDANLYNHIFSFAENTFDKVYSQSRENRALLERHNRRYLMRVYPASYRVKSDNFNPLKFWRRGTQMCAMNWQVFDHGMQLNHAMFAAGDDQSGYVLKPADMRPSENIENGVPVAPFHKPSKRRVRFSIDVISAQQLPKPRGLAPDAAMNPFIMLEVFTAEDKDSASLATAEGGLDHPSSSNGASSNKALGGLRKFTRIIPDNGYDPSFHEHFVMTVDTRFPSLVFVRWTVYNSPDGKSLNISDQNKLASYTAKLESLQSGYRHIKLFNKTHEQFYFSTLFCRVVKEPAQVIPDDVDECAAPQHEQQVVVGSPDSRTGFFKRILKQGSIRRKDNTHMSTTTSVAGSIPSGGPSTTTVATYAAASVASTSVSVSGTNTPSLRKINSIDSSLNGVAIITRATV